MPGYGGLYGAQSYPQENHPIVSQLNLKLFLGPFPKDWNFISQEMAEKLFLTEGS